MPTPHRRPANAGELLAQADRLQSSDAYCLPTHPDHRRVHGAVERIYRTVYGSETEDVPGQARPGDTRP